MPKDCFYKSCVTEYLQNYHFLGLLPRPLPDPEYVFQDTIFERRNRYGGISKCILDYEVGLLLGYIEHINGQYEDPNTAIVQEQFVNSYMAR